MSHVSLSSTPSPHFTPRFSISQLLKRRKSANVPLVSSPIPSSLIDFHSPSPSPPSTSSTPSSSLSRRRTISLNNLPFVTSTSTTSTDSSSSFSSLPSSPHPLPPIPFPSSSSSSLLSCPPSPYSASLSDYSLGPTVGFGASALVVSATYIPLNLNVAIKRIDLDSFHQSQIDELRKEVQTMTLCRHPYLLPVYQSFISANHLYIVTPLRTAGAVNYILKSLFPNGLPEQAILTILSQILLGISYLHKHGICHRDIKSGNILIDRQTGLTQLGDFGVSSSICEGVHRVSRRSFVGTVLWMAPEVMEQSSYNSKADIWSLGITCLEMAQGRAPNSQFPPLKVCMLVLNNPPPTLNRQNSHYKYSRALKDFIDTCLLRNPTLRPSADKLLSNPLVKKAKKPLSLVKTLDLASLPPLQVTLSTVIDEDCLPSSVSRWDFDSPTSEFPIDSIPIPPVPESPGLQPGPRPRANSAMDIFQLH